MKIKPEHLAALSVAVRPHDTPERRAQYIARQFPRAELVRDINMRYRWDCLHASCLKIGDGVGTDGLPLYAYMDDSHIDTALRHIIPNLEA